MSAGRVAQVTSDEWGAGTANLRRWVNGEGVPTDALRRELARWLLWSCSRHAATPEEVLADAERELDAVLADLAPGGHA